MPEPSPEAGKVLTPMTPKILSGDMVSGVAEEGHYVADLGGVQLDFYFRPGVRRRAMIFSPGFLNRRDYPAPYFQRIRWFERFDAFGISLSDPTLALSRDIQLGWFLGTPQNHYLTATADYLTRLLATLDISPESTLFFGSSAGGFASLMFASHVRGSVAFAANPQVDLLRFHDFGEIARTAALCLGSRNAIRLAERYPARLNVAEFWARQGHVPRTMIWQNMFDDYHLRHHVLPLLDRVRQLQPTNPVSLELAARPEYGHNPPAQTELMPFFDRALGWLKD